MVIKVSDCHLEKILVSLTQQYSWGVTSLNIPSLWSQTRGKGVKVCILDTGVAATHPDLVNAIVDTKDFTGSKFGAYDIQGHGTHVSGIIAAGDNSLGVVGVAPECSLYVGKVLGDDGFGQIPWIVNGIRWAIDQKVDLISMSLGSPEEDPALHEAIKEAYSKNIAIFAAAGNDGSNPKLDSINWPARYPEVISVGSIDKSLLRSDFSSTGNRIDIMAPGGKIVSTYPPKNYVVLSGTSMATPFAAAVGALCLSKHRMSGGATPVDTPQDLKDHLLKTSTDVESAGWDRDTGFGIINPTALLKDTLPPPVAGPLMDFQLEFYQGLTGTLTISAHSLNEAKQIARNTIATSRARITLNGVQQSYFRVDQFLDEVK